MRGMKWLFVLAMVMIMVSSTVRAQSNSTIAFTEVLDEEIWTMNDDGSNQTPISDPDMNVEDRDPAICRMARKVVFQRTDNSPLGNAHPDIWIMDIDGGGQVNLTAQFPDASDQNPHCGSPGDGGGQEYIVFSSDRDSNTDELYRMDLHGNNVFRLTTDEAGDASAAWCGDGFIFSTSRHNQLEIYTMDEWGGNQTRLTFNAKNDRHPSCSKRGGRFAAFYRENGSLDHDIIKMVISTMVETNLTPGPGENDRYPTWSAGGTAIAFSHSAKGIYKMSSNGGPITSLNTPGISAQPDWREVAPE